MLGLQDEYNSGNNWVPSFSYKEFTSNEGYVTFYPFDSASSALTVNSSIYASGGYVQDPTGSEFNILINKPIRAQGNLIVNIPSLLKNNYGSAQNCSQYFLYNIAKVSNSITTIIASGATSTHSKASLAGGGGIDSGMTLGSMQITPTDFKIGDTLKFMVWNKATSQQGSVIQLMGSDPVNRTDVYTGSSGDWVHGSRSVVNIPFRVDLE